MTWVIAKIFVKSWKLITEQPQVLKPSQDVLTQKFKKRTWDK